MARCGCSEHGVHRAEGKCSILTNQSSRAFCSLGLDKRITIARRWTVPVVGPDVADVLVERGHDYDDAALVWVGELERLKASRTSGQ